MGAVAGSDVAATREPGGPQGPVDASWLILQRLSDIKEQMGELRQQVGDLHRAQDDFRDSLQALDTKIDSRVDGLCRDIDSVRRDLDAEIDSVRNWSLGLLLLAILGLLAKLLLPGA